MFSCDTYTITKKKKKKKRTVSQFTAFQDHVCQTVVWSGCVSAVAMSLSHQRMGSEGGGGSGERVG